MTETGIDNRVQNELKDFYGNPLRDGIYFAGDGKKGDFYSIQISTDDKRFLAES